MGLTRGQAAEALLDRRILTAQSDNDGPVEITASTSAIGDCLVKYVNCGVIGERTLGQVLLEFKDFEVIDSEMSYIKDAIDAFGWVLKPPSNLKGDPFIQGMINRGQMLLDRIERRG